MHGQSQHDYGIVAVVDVGLRGLFAKLLGVRLDEVRFGVSLTRSWRSAIRPFEILRPDVVHHLGGFHAVRQQKLARKAQLKGLTNNRHAIFRIAEQGNGLWFALESLFEFPTIRWAPFLIGHSDHHLATVLTQGLAKGLGEPTPIRIVHINRRDSLKPQRFREAATHLALQGV